MASLVHNYTTRSGRKIIVIDFAISEEMANHLYEYYHCYSLWNFHANEDKDGDNVQFISGIDNDTMEKSPLWKKLNQYVTKFFGTGYRPYNCSVNHTRYGDSPFMHRDTYDQQAKDVTLLLYLNPFWNVDFSGETVYFDEKMEIEFTVLPKFCRLAIHEGYINHASRAPSRIFTNSRYTLAIKGTSDKEYFSNKVSENFPAVNETMNRKNFLIKNIFGNIMT